MKACIAPAQTALQYQGHCETLGSPNPNYQRWVTLHSAEHQTFYCIFIHCMCNGLLVWRVQGFPVCSFNSSRIGNTQNGFPYTKITSFGEKAKLSGVIVLESTWEGVMTNWGGQQKHGALGH